MRQDKFSRARKTAAGFTLIEVLISIILLMIVMIGLMGLQLTTVRQSTTSQRASEATRLAQSRIEHFQPPTPLPQPVSPNNAWHYAINQNGTQMLNISGDGLTPGGPYTVEEISEADAATSQTVFTVRVTWLDVMRSTGTNAYQTRELTMSTKR